MLLHSIPQGISVQPEPPVLLPRYAISGRSKVIRSAKAQRQLCAGNIDRSWIDMAVMSVNNAIRLEGYLFNLYR